MPLIEAIGTKVARISPERLNISIAPARNCESMAVSPPSWLFGKIWISMRPFDSSRILSTALANCTLTGWATTTLLAYRQENSAASLRRVRMAKEAMPALAAAVLRRNARRDSASIGKSPVYCCDQALCSGIRDRHGARISIFQYLVCRANATIEGVAIK